eukprot:tig00020556_g11010.t1
MERRRPRAERGASAPPSLQRHSCGSSSDAEGSFFTPLLIAADLAHAHASTAPPSPTAGSDISKSQALKARCACPLHILVADDELMNRTMARRAFTAACPNAAFRSVNDGREAVEAFCDPARASRFDVCVLDFEMPHLTGPEVAQAMRRAEAKAESSGGSGGGAPGPSPSAAVLVAWTSLDVHSRPLRERCRAAGFDRAFCKQEGLRHVVSRTLSLVPHESSCPFRAASSEDACRPRSRSPRPGEAI